MASRRPAVLSMRLTRSQRAVVASRLPGGSRAGRGGSLPDSGQVGGHMFVTSLTATGQVMQAREREREAGGPTVPHNSLDLSVIDLSETVAEAAGDTQEVFQDEEVEEPPLSPSEQGSLRHTLMPLQDNPRRGVSPRLLFFGEKSLKKFRLVQIIMP